MSGQIWVNQWYHQFWYVDYGGLFWPCELYSKRESTQFEGGAFLCRATLGWRYPCTYLCDFSGGNEIHWLVQFRSLCFLGIANNYRFLIFLGGLRDSRYDKFYVGDLPKDDQNCYSCRRHLKHPKNGKLYKMGHIATSYYYTMWWSKHLDSAAELWKSLVTLHGSTHGLSIFVIWVSVQSNILW